MKKLFISLSLAVALLATSCETDPTNDDSLLGGGKNTENVESPEQEEGANKAVAYLTVGIDNSDTRISLGDEEEGLVPLYWSTGDKLAINRTLESEGIEAEYDGMDTAKIGMSEEVVSSLSYPLVVMYPAEVATGRSEWFYIDSEQAYLQGHLSNGFGILMGKAESEGDVIQMKHMCGYMKVSLTGSATVKKVMLRTTGHEPLSGYFRHAENATDIGMSRFNESGLADGYYNSPVICINCDEGVTLSSEATDFYFAIPAGDYPKGFALYVMDSNGNQQRVKAYSSGKTIEAGKMIKMPPLPVNCTEPWGIRNGNELASFARTLEKNVWLNIDNKTISLRGDANLANEDLSECSAHYNGGILGFRENYSSYNNDKVEVIDGYKSETENYAITNLKRTTTTNGALLFGTIREELTVQNLTLGKTADDPTTDKEEADCVITITPNSTAYTYCGVFCYINAGIVKNCISNVSIKGSITASKGILTGAFCAGGESSTGSFVDCINHGHICLDLANTDTANYIGGILPRNYGPMSGCKNYGTIEVNNASATTNMGGIVGYAPTTEITSCHNYGAIKGNDIGKVRAGGICGYSNYAAENNFDGCTNGVDGSTTSGSITITSISGEVNCGGIVGVDATSTSIYNAINYAPLTISGTAIGYVGGIVGNIKKPVSNCKNYGAINISGFASGYSYFGGIGGGASGGSALSTATSCENYGDITVNCTAKSRIGGIAGYTKTMKGSCVVRCNITINNAGKDSNVGGITGYTNNNTKTGFSYEGTITNNTTDATIYIGGVAGQLNGNTLTNCYIKPIIIDNGGVAVCGLITAGAVGLNSGTPYTLTLGAENKPVKISNKTSFLGMSISDISSIVDRPEDGENKPYLLNDTKTAAALTLSKVNLTVVD